MKKQRMKTWMMMTLLTLMAACGTTDADDDAPAGPTELKLLRPISSIAAWTSAFTSASSRTLQSR